MQMKKRVLSVLLALCLAGSLASTVWATGDQATPETAAKASAETVGESTPETADEPSYPAQEFEAAVHGADMTVNVSAPEGALPEDVTLTAALVGSSEDDADDQAVADVAAELNDAGVEYDGFVALDISFVDADGNKVEPLQPVSVNFTLPAELLPEDVDASTLEVQHLKENEAGEVEAVETVADTADATEGTVTVDTPVATLSEDGEATLPADAAVTAEFTVDGFSYFVLSYNAGMMQLKVLCVDEEGNAIGDDQSLGSVSFGNTFTGGKEKTVEEILSELNQTSLTNQGYKFKEARVYVSDKNSEGNEYVETAIADSFKYVSFFDGFLETGWAFHTPNQDGFEEGWHNMTVLNEWFGNTEYTVYFVYEKEEEEEPEIPTVTVPDHSKTVFTNNDGTYTLKLDVEGNVTSSTNKLQLNLMLIIDQSGSMAEYISDGHGDTQSKKDAVISAVQDLTDTLKNNDNVSVNYNVITFSDYKHTQSVTGWTKDIVKVNDAVSNMQTTGGTNYQAAIREAKAQLSSADNKVASCAIFLTDGDPTYRMWGNSEVGFGNSDPLGWNIDSAVSEISSMGVDSFYCIGTGDSGDLDTSNLQRLCDAVAATDTGWFTATNTDSLKDAFAKIAGATTTLATKNIQIKDTLSDYVVPATAAQPHITVKDGNEVIAEADNTVQVDGVTIRAELSGKQLTLIFPEDYVLKDGWIYSVTLKIQPSELAISDYEARREKGEDYPDTADEETGTHALQSGYYSNNSATLTYKGVNDPDAQDPTVVEYKKPVIQIDDSYLTPPTTDLTIIKEVDDSVPESVDLSGESYTFIIAGPASLVDEEGITYPYEGKDTPLSFEAGTGDNQGKAVASVTVSGEGSITIKGLPTKMDYTVTEGMVEDIDTNPNDGKQDYYPVVDETKYQVDSGQESKNCATITNLSQPTSVTVTNTYKPYKTLTVKKVVSGEMGSYSDYFDFSAKIAGVGDSQYSATLINRGSDEMTNSDGYDFKLNSNGDVTLVNLKENDVVTIFEAPGDSRGYTAKAPDVTSEVLVNENIDPESGNYTLNGNTRFTITVPDGNITDLGTITFNNEREAVAPTGLESNHTAPYTIMVTVAGIAGLALIGGMVVRRRRRRME